MSWVRFSTRLDNGKQSDLYIYDDVAGGVTVMTASRRRVGIENAPKDLDIVAVGADEWLAQNNKVEKWFEENREFEEIQDPRAGKTYNFDDMDELKALLDGLRACGFNFPDYLYEYIEGMCTEYSAKLTE